MLTKAESKMFRRVLEHRQAELESKIRNREGLAIDTSSEQLDQIQRANDRDWAMSSLERNSARLREVRLALRRIAAGTFGICVACEENINPKRLTAVPWASSCIACQQAADRGQLASSIELETPLVPWSPETVQGM